MCSALMRPLCETLLMTDVWPLQFVIQKFNREPSKQRQGVRITKIKASSILLSRQAPALLNAVTTASSSATTVTAAG